MKIKENNAIDILGNTIYKDRSVDNYGERSIRGRETASCKRDEGN